MKKTNIKFLVFMIGFILFLLYGCSNNNLELKTKSVTQQLNQVSTIGTQIGNTPYDFTVVTTDGKAVILGDFLRNRKPVIVYFFATWCPYCHQDLTALSKVYKDYENHVSMIAISIDLSEDLNLLKEYKKKYPELQSVMFAEGQSEILINYKVIKTTTKYAIGKDEKIMYAGFGAFDEEQWKVLLEALSK